MRDILDVSRSSVAGWFDRRYQQQRIPVGPANKLVLLRYRAYLRKYSILTCRSFFVGCILGTKCLYPWSCEVHAITSS